MSISKAVYLTQMRFKITRSSFIAFCALAPACGQIKPTDSDGIDVAAPSVLADPSQVEAAIKLDANAQQDCRVIEGVKICIRSDFDRAIDLEIANNSTAIVEFNPGFKIYNSTVSVFDVDGQKLSPDLWEGSPLPSLPSLTSREQTSFQFTEDNSLDWTNLKDAHRICYLTRLYPKSPKHNPRLLRVCIDES